MKELDYSVHEVVLAALLHDVGKFAQRASADSKAELGDTAIATYCPRNAERGYPTHIHAAHTHAFVLGLRDQLPDGVRAEVVARLAAKHHRPSSDDPWEEVIALADQVSAGQDRRDLPDEADKANDAARAFRTKPLTSIFSSLRINGGAKSAGDAHRLASLEYDDALPAPSVTLSQEAYASHWKSFVADVSLVSDASARGSSGENRAIAYIDAMAAVLERYTWCIPAATNNLTDVSLYDHSVSAAAFAGALWGYIREGADSLDAIVRTESRSGGEFFLLVSGDMSGIQRYLFDLRTTKANAKTLRARSLELQLATEAIAHRLLRSMGLPRTGLVYSAAGRFLVVLPNTEDARRQVEHLRREVDDHFLDAYAGALTFSITDGVACSARDLDQKTAGALFARIREDVGEWKHRKLQGALQSSGHVLRGYWESADDTAVPCDVCGIRPAKREGLCSRCADVVRIGRKVPGAACYSFEGVGRRPSSRVGDSYLPFQLSARFLHDDDCPDADSPTWTVNRFVPGRPIRRMPYHIPLTNSTDDADVDDGRQRATMVEGEIEPPEAGDAPGADRGRVPMDFSEIASHAAGPSNLAMLKMDVDRLGLLFSKGLGDNLSMARYATLSRRLDFFFSAGIHRLLEDGKFDLVYTVFSGGDDLCVIGPWNTILHFAQRVHDEFATYVGGERVTISGGISIEPPGVPVRAMAERAERALEDAKDGGRNRVTAFGATVSWPVYAQMLKEGEWLAEQSRGENAALSAGFVYRLLGYIDRKRGADEGRVSERNLTWKSHFAYALARMEQRSKGFADEHKDRLTQLIVGTDEASLNEQGNRAAIAVQYALYMNRERRT